jgi:hypothetical protein
MAWAGNTALPADTPTPPTTQQKINSKLQKVGLSQTWQLESAMSSVLALGIIQGNTEAQMYALNPGYRDAKDLLAEIRALEAQL